MKGVMISEHTTVSSTPCPSEEDLLLSWDAVTWDDFDSYDDWQSFVEQLTDLMEGHKYWGVEVLNFGWMKKHGYKTVETSRGAVLLDEIMPKTECTFKIYAYKNGFALRNWHHDSPTGNEWYIIQRRDSRE